MSKVIKPPTKLTDEMFEGKTLFTAGTIDMGNSEDWQSKVCEGLNDSYTVFNPRRDDWDSSWKQEIGNRQFRAQVEWELEALERCELIIMVFLKDSESPISLLELGLHAKDDKMIVFCPDGFYRKGNVDVVCKKFNIPQFDDIDELVEYLNENFGEEKSE